MSVADWVSALLCFVLPLVAMLAAIAALTWSKREFGAMLRTWIDRK